MRRETLFKVFATLIKISFINILAASHGLDEDKLEELFEECSLWDGSLYEKAKEIKASSLEPNIAHVINYVRSSSATRKIDGHSCNDDEIHSMTNFHNFMLSHSEKYRNVDIGSEAICCLIGSHWNYMIKCLEKETKDLHKKLRDEKWQLLATMMKNFWRITSSKGDIHSLDIASDILARRRKIRDARERPRDWVRMIYDLLAEEKKSNSDPSKKIVPSEIYGIIENFVIVDDTSESKRSNRAYIDNLYNRLIVKRCKMFQEDERLMKSLWKTAKLAGVTQWPRVFKEREKIFATKLHEPTLEQLTLGLIVCNELNEHFLESAVENGVALVQALDDRSPSDSGEIDELELEKLLAYEENTTLSVLARRVTTDSLEPDIAHAIRYAQSAYDDYPSCSDKEVEDMRNFHDFMLNHSESYRNIIDESKTIRMYMNAQWKLVTKCLDNEGHRFIEKFRSYDTFMAIKFRKITNNAGDVFYLNIASEIAAGKRKIRSARENPREWAEIFEQAMKEKVINDLFDYDDYEDKQLKQNFGENLYDLFERETELNESTGVRHPKGDFIGKLYDLILKQCKQFQEDEELVEYLEKALRLAESTHWAKSDTISTEIFWRKFDEPLLGPLALRFVVCNRLKNNFRRVAIKNGDAIVAALFDRIGWDELNEYELENLLAGGIPRARSMHRRLKKIPTTYLEPNLAKAIKFVEDSIVIKQAPKPTCGADEINHMKNIHNFMSQKSKLYRNNEEDLFVIRFLIDNQWEYLIKCLDVIDRSLSGKLKDPNLQTLSRMMAEFWYVTSTRRDIYSLDIVADISSGKRKVRDAMESPRDWAKMIKSMLWEHVIGTEIIGRRTNPFYKDIATTKIKHMLEEVISVDAVTGVRYPREGYIGELYDRLILQRCKTLRSDEQLVKFLEYYENLATLTQWPKKGRRGSLLRTERDVSTTSSLTLGLVVCNELHEHYRNAVVENQVALSEVLSEEVSGPIPTDKSPLITAHHFLAATCEGAEDLVSILRAADALTTGKELKMLIEQMKRLKTVAELAPDDFSCKDNEVESIAVMARTVTRLLSVTNGPISKCCQLFGELITELKEQFLNRCLRGLIEKLGRLADEKTIIHILRMPIFWHFLGRESVPSLRDSLINAGLLFNGSKEILSSLQDERNWSYILNESVSDMFSDPPEYLSTRLGGYWKQAQEQSLVLMNPKIAANKRVTVYAKKSYKYLIVGWCEIFEPNTTHFNREYSEGVKRLVETASSLVRWNHGSMCFSNLEGFLHPDEEFLIKQSVIGFSLCIHLDPAKDQDYALRFHPSKRRTKVTDKHASTSRSSKMN